ncbi:MAG: HAMP domain-containing histidine kinase [Labilithrix sp.]|nr:HAMP domain-containing histidine kinase [Labilithrix sp.]
MSWQLKVGPWVIGGRWGSVSRTRVEAGRHPRGDAERGARLSHLRPSLRANALLMVLAMLALPQLIVVGWSLMERDIGGKLQWEARSSADEAAEALAAAAGLVGGGPEARPLEESATGERQGRLDETATGEREARLDEIATRELEAKLDEIASRWGTRVRVIDEGGATRFDVDADRNTDLVHQIGTLFFGPDGAPTLRELDETLGPVQKRAEVVEATGWRIADAPAPRPLPEGSAHVYPFVRAPAPDDGAAAVTGCRTSPAGKLLVCHAARAASLEGRPHVIYVQESSRRAVRALYDLRYHLARLSIVMLPFALIFSWWMGRRMARPIEWLRERVLEKARSANPRADIDLHGGDEVRDLAEAFNGLLGALDERRRANEAFVADLVHEFKNPVAAIRTCAESLASGAADEQRAARIARILSDSSGRLDALVSQFLELARAEAGLPREDRVDVDVGALAAGVTSSVEPAFEDVRFSVEAAPAAIVVGVAPRLDSLVRNLVDNAASFAGRGGEVRVVVRREPAPSAASGSSYSSSSSCEIVALEVSDTGPGIAAEDLPHVFDRFFTKRARASAEPEAASPRRDGSGLGLALVKAVAEAHGGEVSARSTPGEGATFRVTLPAKP